MNDKEFMQIFREKVEEEHIQKIIDERIAQREVYLAVSFEDKDHAKSLGALWDRKEKCWYSTAHNLIKHPALAHYQISSQDWLNQQPSVENVGSWDLLRQKCERLGLHVNGVNFMDAVGKDFQRCPVEGKGSRNETGAYKVFRNDDGTYGAHIRNFATGVTDTWGSREGNQYLAKIPKHIEDANRLNAEIRKQESDKVREEILQERHKTATQLFKSLPNARGDEPYFTNKQMHYLHGIKRLENGALVIPFINGEAKGTMSCQEKTGFGITTLQVIQPDGKKMMMAQGKIMGSYFPLGSKEARDNPTHILIAEGIATADAVYQAFHHLTGASNACVLAISATNANNLLPVTQTLSKLYPNAQKIIAVDNDIKTKEQGFNTGIDKAKQVKEEFPDVILAIPDPINQKSTDWNDVLVHHGVEKTAQQLKEKITQKTNERTQNSAQKPAVSVKKKASEIGGR